MPLIVGLASVGSPMNWVLTSKKTTSIRSTKTVAFLLRLSSTATALGAILILLVDLPCTLTGLGRAVLTTSEHIRPAGSLADKTRQAYPLNRAIPTRIRSGDFPRDLNSDFDPNGAFRSGTHIMLRPGDFKLKAWATSTRSRREFVSTVASTAEWPCSTSLCTHITVVSERMNYPTPVPLSRKIEPRALSVLALVTTSR